MFERIQFALSGSRLTKFLITIILLSIASVFTFSAFGSSDRDQSAVLGKKAGEWLVNSDIFYTPSTSFIYVDQLCEKNYQSDSGSVDNRGEYLTACRDSFFEAQAKLNANQQSSNYDPYYNTQEPNPPSDSDPSPSSTTGLPDSSPNYELDPAAPKEVKYWIPNIKNIVSCSSDLEDPCWLLPVKPIASGNTFGEDGAQIAASLIDAGICYGTGDQPAISTYAECRYDDQGNWLQITTGDAQIQIATGRRNYAGVRWAVLKDGLAVTSTSNDRELITRVSGILGGQVRKIGSE